MDKYPTDCHSFAYRLDMEAASQVLEGYRMKAPTSCPTIIVDLMTHCWHQEPSSRYTFETIVKVLTQFWEDENKTTTTSHAPEQKKEDPYSFSVIANS